MLSILDQYVEKNLLRKAEDENLVQYNYTEYCNNEGLWDNITMENRGNIYEKSSGKLIAKAMPKRINVTNRYKCNRENGWLSWHSLFIQRRNSL